MPDEGRKTAYNIVFAVNLAYVLISVPLTYMMEGAPNSYFVTLFVFTLESLISIGTGTRLPWRAEPEFTEDGRRYEDASEKNRSVWLIPDTDTEKIKQLYGAGFIE